METLSTNWEVIKTSDASLMGLPPKSIAEIKSRIKGFKLDKILEINLKRISPTNLC